MEKKKLIEKLTYRKLKEHYSREDSQSGVHLNKKNEVKGLC